MLTLSRWWRLLILCLLIPAYGIAAAGVSSYAGGEITAERLLIEGHRLTTASPTAMAEQATGVEPNGPSTSPQIDAQIDGHVDDITQLMLEHGDTSDDMSDHCLPHLSFAVTAFAPVAAPAAAPTRAPDAPPGRLLRPPRG